MKYPGGTHQKAGTLTRSVLCSNKGFPQGRWGHVPVSLDCLHGIAGQLQGRSNSNGLFI